jgi:Tol biopolymer transport system component
MVASERRQVRIARVLVSVVSLLVGPTWAGSEKCDPPTLLKNFPIEHAIGAKWNAASKTMAYGRPRKDGTYAAFISDIDGGHQRRVAFSGWRDDRQQFPVAWHPSGRYLVLSVEKPEHPGSRVDATPGYGGYSDYWLVTPDGASALKLVDLPNDRDHAITHAAFSPDGSKFVWSERIKAPRITSLNLFAGTYRFNVADFIETETPHLTNVRGIIPEGVAQGGEVESIASDDKTIAFYSTFRTKNLFAARIYTMDIESGAISELTTQSWSQAPTFTPDGGHIVYMSGAQADVFPFSLQGADWWIMRRDGSYKQRLTFMNRRGNPQSVGKFRLAGSLTFISDSRFFGDVMTKSLGLVGQIIDVTMLADCVDPEKEVLRGSGSGQVR